MQRAKLKAKERTKAERMDIFEQAHHTVRVAHPGVTAAAPRGHAGIVTRQGIPELIVLMNRYATTAINQGTKGMSAQTRERREEVKVKMVKAKMEVAGKVRG